MKISEEVRKALGRYPYIEEYLSMGLINNRALARGIQDYIRDENQAKVNLQSIVSAIRRYPTAQDKPGRGKLLKILADSEVNLRYDVGTATLRIGKESPRKIDEVHRALKGRRYMLLQGMQTLTVVAEEADLLKLEEKAEVNKNLATVIVTSPEEIVTTSGVIAHLAGLLAMEGINVVEMMSSHTETSFIVAERDALKTVEIIRNEIKRARGDLGG